MLSPFTFCIVYLLAASEASSSSTRSTTLKPDLKCTTNDKLDLLILVDGTSALQRQYPKWRSTIQGIADHVTNHIGSTRIGLASFTDKPIPFRGKGLYGNYQTGAQDYCYKRHLALEQYKKSTLSHELEELDSKVMSNPDAMQGQLEALLLSAVDSHMHWTIDDAGYEACNTQVITLFTASEQHRPNDAWSARNDWNWERVYLDGYENPSMGGFGSDDFPNLGSLNLATDQDRRDYETLVAYFHTIDGYAAGAPGYESNITEEQQNHLNTLLSKFGPYPYPALQYPIHPGDASEPDCSLTEYPGPSKVGHALSARSIFPVLFTTPNVYNYYQNQLIDLGVESVVIELDSLSTPEELAGTLLTELGLPSVVPTVSAQTVSTNTYATSVSDKPSAATSLLATSSVLATRETTSVTALSDPESTTDTPEYSTATEVLIESAPTHSALGMKVIPVALFILLRMV